MNKADIRKKYLALRNNIPKEIREAKSRAIVEKIVGLPLYEEAEWLFTFINIGSEAETRGLIEKTWSKGKKVAVPIAVKGSRKMYFVPLYDFDSLVRKPFGVLEPDADETMAVLPGENDIFIVPGAVFDINKNRFGYGGGYYDIYFSQTNVKHKIGVAFEIQIASEALPIEKHDYPLDCIITEERII